MSDGFRVTSSVPLLHSYVFDVERVSVAHGGQAFERDVARHRGAVAILAINDAGEIGVLRQFRATMDRTTLEIPAGTCDVVGEDALATAQRELREEMGCEAATWRLLARLMVSPGWTDQLMLIYEARDLRELDRRPEGPEESAATTEWLSPERLREVLAGEPAIDATMAAALNRVYGTFFD
ncbi:MAG TPA: NUDIX hydrolase [Acidimicrobiales bacterium]|nr:NUDIX hydrolase [Acidimicrobiales bacterium]